MNNPRVLTNFGKIGNQRVVSFDMDAKKDVVVPRSYKALDDPEGRQQLHQMGLMITPHEAFRRWKIARKAWRSRRWKHQLPLPL